MSILRRDPMSLKGKTFGRWTVGRFIKRNKKSHCFYECQCSCGTVRVVDADSLKRGNTRSCGCLFRELVAARSYIHGLTGSPLYTTWSGMIQRCKNPKNINYPLYGERGIEVCNRWTRFKNFAEDMKVSYAAHCESYGVSNTTIDRIDNEGSYYPENCKWATYKEQRANQRDLCTQRLFEATRLSDGYTEGSNNQNGFAREHDLHAGSINDVLKGRRKTHKGWVFNYLSKEEISGIKTAIRDGNGPDMEHVKSIMENYKMSEAAHGGSTETEQSKAVCISEA